MKLFIVILLITVLSVISARRRGKVVTLDSFEWDIDTPNVKIDAKSAITINVIAETAPQSDRIIGQNLWKLGIFGSEYSDGSGERIGLREQILTTKQASKELRKGKPLKLKNIQSRFDVSQIGCGEFPYFCVEFAKNPESTVDFELRTNVTLESIVRCKELECRRPNSSVMADEAPDMCFQECPSEPEVAGWPVCGSNGESYSSLCELDKAAQCKGVEVELKHYGECLPAPPDPCLQECPSENDVAGGPVCGSNGESYSSLCELDKAAQCKGVEVELKHHGECLPVRKAVQERPPVASFERMNWCINIVSQYKVSVDASFVPRPSSDTIRGNGLWRLGLFISNASSGAMARDQYQPNILNAINQAKPLIKGTNLEFSNVPAALNTTGIPCDGDFWQFFCIEFDKGENPNPYFRFASRDPWVVCTRFRCREVPGFLSLLLGLG